MKRMLLLMALIAGITTADAQTTWGVDKAHTNINFAITHMVVGEVTGNFKMFSGSVVSKNDDFTDAQIDFSIDVNSINTDNESRDKHLKADDFFNAEKYPTITFKGTSFKKVKGNNYALEGNLTIRDVTKKVKLDVVYNGTVKDPYGNTKAGFKVTGAIDRFEYNLKWNNMFDGGPVAGKEVRLNINLQLKKQ